MAWIDLDTGRPYTAKELEALKSSEVPAPEAQQAQPDAMPEAAPAQGTQHMPDPSQVHDFPSAASHMGQQALGGAEASLKRTYLGLKQLATYLTGNDEARNKVNEEIQRMEEEYGPVLATPAGKVGELAGVVGQFAIPGAVASKVGQAIPATAKAAAAIAGAPGSVRRAATTAALFEGTQPVNVHNTSTEDMATQKLARMALGAGVGAGASAVTNKLLNPGIPTPQNRRILESTAKQQGYELRPAQRTNEPSFWSKEKAYGIHPETIEAMNASNAAQRAIPDEKALEALGIKGAPLNADSLEFAKQKANRLYDTVKSIGPFPHDPSAAQDMAQLIANTPEIAAKGDHLLKLMPKMDGQRFASQLQKLRNDIRDAYKAGGAGTNTAEGLKDLYARFEQYGDDAVQTLASTGQASADALSNLRRGREAWAVIHRIEPHVNNERQSLDVRKFLRSEEKYHPVAKSPTDKHLKKLRDVSETWRAIQPPANLARTSSTPEGLNALAKGNLFGRMLGATKVGDAATRYLNEREFVDYMTKAGQPSFLGNRLPASLNLQMRRMLPQLTLGAGEAITE